MERIPPRADTALIHKILTELPIGIRKLLGHVPFVIDHDPAWIGLHFYQDAGNGRSYQETAHVAYPCHQPHLPGDRRQTTVVLARPHLNRRLTILHELGHVLDERLGFPREAFVPLTEYARSSRWEIFATAFQAWATASDNECHPYCYATREQLLKQDRQGFTFFERLGQGGSEL